MKLLRRNWFPIAAGAICFIYAFIAWLTVTPNQDILADGIQAQSLLTDPRVVLAFPGQKHAGPLEYPYTVLAEWIFPGNYYANAAIRPLLAFATGFLVAKLFLSLFARAPKWSLLAAIAVGPAVLHGYIGPSNAVGVWWMQPNWDMAWLLVTLGALILSRLCDAGTPRWRRGIPGALLAGLALALGFYAHPAISLMLIPLVTLVLLLTRQRIRDLFWVLVGGLIGVIPAAVSYVVNAHVNSWDPSHGAFISFTYYRDMGAAVLGLDSIPDHMLALLPYGLGLPPDQSLITGALQSFLVAIFLIVVVISSLIATVTAIRARRRISGPGAIALAWVTAVIVMFAFITFVDPVWLYSSGYVILFWLSLGALPLAFRSQVIGTLVTIALALLVLVSTVSHGRAYFANLAGEFQFKIDTQNELKQLAVELEDSGVTFVYGSYYDAIPVGYASGGKLRTVTNRYNRFPATAEELDTRSYLVAVRSDPTEEWGREALMQITSECVPTELIAVGNRKEFRVFNCPSEALQATN